MIHPYMEYICDFGKMIIANSTIMKFQSHTKDTSGCMEMS